MMDHQDFMVEELPENPTEEWPIHYEMIEDTGTVDPLSPTLRGQALDSQAKLMLLNVHKYFQKFRILRAKETGADMNVNKVVAMATGVALSTVQKLFSEYRNKGIEWAIRSPVKCTRKRKSDVAIQVEQDSKNKEQKEE